MSRAANTTNHWPSNVIPQCTKSHSSKAKESHQKCITSKVASRPIDVPAQASLLLCNSGQLQRIPTNNGADTLRLGSSSHARQTPACPSSGLDQLAHDGDEDAGHSLPPAAAGICDSQGTPAAELPNEQAGRVGVGKGQLVGPAGQVLPHDRDGQRNVRPAGAVLPTPVCIYRLWRFRIFTGHWWE